MKLHELIERLTTMEQEVGDGAEVRLALPPASHGHVDVALSATRSELDVREAEIPPDVDSPVAERVWLVTDWNDAKAAPSHIWEI